MKKRKISQSEKPEEAVEVIKELDEIHHFRERVMNEVEKSWLKEKEVVGENLSATPPKSRFTMPVDFEKRQFGAIVFQFFIRTSF